MTTLRNVSPAGSTASVLPQLSVRRGRAAIEFYKTAFGALEEYRVGGTDDHQAVVAQLRVGGASFWVADESPAHSNYSPESLGGATTRMLLIVDDPESTLRGAVAAGATEVRPVSEEHRWLLGRIADPFGHHWEIGKPLIEWPPGGRRAGSERTAMERVRSGSGAPSSKGDRDGLGSVALRRVAETDVGADLARQLQALLRVSFHDYPHRTYFKLPPHFRYVAELGDTVVGQLGVELRLIRVGGTILRTFGVVDLCVREDERSHGLASRMLDEVTRSATSCDMDFVMLFADDDRLYANKGWSHVTNHRCSWVKINEHMTLGLALDATPSAMMIKAVGKQSWPEGDVDLLGHIF
jgi:PhnB protein